MNTEFEPKSDVPKQPTVPPMPKVKPPRGRELSGCLDCRNFECDSEEYPCSDCKHSFNAKSENERFAPFNEIFGNINPDDSFECGQQDCIDMMVNVFGVQSMRNLCKLNAFAHLLRDRDNDRIEDIKRAVWYLNKLIELSDTEPMGKTTDKKE